MQLPTWLSEEAWDGYVEMRTKIKKPMTERAKKMAVRRLDELRCKGWDPSMVLDQSTFMCWQGLYPLRGDFDGDKADRKTFDSIRRDSSFGAIQRTVAGYKQVGSNLFGTPPQGSKRGGNGGIH